MIDRLINSKGEDRILLLSGGPKSHLARKSMLAIGMKKRIVITQPNIKPAEKHSPLNGETRLTNKKAPMQGSLQELSEDGWKVTNLLHAKSMDEMFRSLKPHTKRVTMGWCVVLRFSAVDSTNLFATSPKGRRNSCNSVVG